MRAAEIVQPHVVHGDCAVAAIASISRMLDFVVVAVGMRPVVAIMLVELGLVWPGVRMVLNVDRRIAVLDESFTSEAGVGPCVIIRKWAL